MMPVMSPPLPAPRRTNFNLVKRWVKMKVFGFSGYDTCYADNTPGIETVFHTDNHTKYTAACNFKEHPELAATGSAYQRWKIGVASRSSDAHKAYFDFLRGLEVAGAQEYPGHGVDKSIPTNDQIEILHELGVIPSNNPLKDLRELAEYERLVQLRKDAALRRMWYMRLQHRAWQSLEDDPSPGLHPPIRESTFKLLVRPVEADFDLTKAVLLFVSVGTLMQAFATQIATISILCSGAFMCPSKSLSGWRHRPVPAPPAAFRRPGTIMKKTDYASGSTELTCSVLYSNGACSDPGYKIEWPYLETKGALEVTPELATLCKKSLEGYVYDPYRNKLVEEYWECPKGNNAFSHDGVDFHFDHGWYDAAHRVTLDCMMEIEKDKTKWQTGLTLFTTADAQKKLESCFYTSAAWTARNPAGGGVCDCRATNAFFYLDSVDRSNVNEHQLFGCMFDSPTAGALIPSTYNACSSTPRTEQFFGVYNNADADRIAEAKKLDSETISRRAMLVSFFVIKEAGPLGGIAGIVLLSVFYAIIFIPALLVVLLIRFEAKHNSNLQRNGNHPREIESNTMCMLSR